MPEVPSKIKPAVFGGIIIALISSIPFLNLLNCCCCAGILLGGFMSVFFYTRELTPLMPGVTAGDGVLLGLFAGVFGAVGTMVIEVLLMATVGPIANESLMELLRTFADQVPPEVMDQIEERIAAAGTLSAATVMMSLVTNLILDSIFGLLGGLIGFAVFKRKEPMINVQPPMPPMNPPGATA